MLLLLVAAEGVDGIHHQRALHRGKGADPAVAPLQLLHDEPVGHVVEPGAAVLLGQVGAEQAQLGHSRDQLLGELALDVGLADDRHQVLVHPGTHGVAHGALLLGEEGVEVEEIDAGKLGCTLRPWPSLPRESGVYSWREYNSGGGGWIRTVRLAAGTTPTSRAFLLNVPP